MIPEQLILQKCQKCSKKQVYFNRVAYKCKFCGYKPIDLEYRILVSQEQLVALVEGKRVKVR